jgi:hypothetical protein
MLIEPQKGGVGMAPRDSTEILYFSGTGNSLFVARELSKDISNSQITPIAACLSKNMCGSSADDFLTLVLQLYSLKSLAYKLCI